MVLRDYEFEAAHRLPRHPGRCSRLHGHSYRLQVQVFGPIDAESGMVVDFDTIDNVVEPILELFDHRLLNDVIDNPTCEVVAVELLRRLMASSVPVVAVHLHETSRGSVVVRVQDLEDEPATP